MGEALVCAGLPALVAQLPAPIVITELQVHDRLAQAHPAAAAQRARGCCARPVTALWSRPQATPRGKR